jgi:hypothetical protein
VAFEWCPHKILLVHLTFMPQRIYRFQKKLPTGQGHGDPSVTTYLDESQYRLDDLSAVAAQQQQYRRQQPAHNALELPSKLEHQPRQAQHSSRLHKTQHAATTQEIY